jgi:serine/threonine protein kinase
MFIKTAIPDNYLLESLVGCGPHTTVWRAREATTNRPYAIKTFRPAVWMRKTEAEALCQQIVDNLTPMVCLRHPNLVSVYEVGRAEQSVYLVRDLPSGDSLRQRLERHDTLSLYEAGQMASQVSEALEALNGTGYVHGALTPDNLFCGTDGRWRVTDAGFMQTASAFPLYGTRCRFLSASPSGDLTALAALVFRSLAGYWPLNRDGTISRAYHLPAPVRNALHRALTGGWNGFRSASDFAQAITLERRPSLFRYAWRPAAATGLIGALVTLGGTAMSEKGVRPETSARKVSVSSALHAEDLGSGKPAIMNLSQEDWQVLRLSVRRQGVALLTNATVAEIFGLTEAQYHDIRECLDDQRARVEWLVDAMDGGAKVDTGATMQKLREDTGKHILAILTPEQRSLWQSLVQTPLASEETIL